MFETDENMEGILLSHMDTKASSVM